MLLGKHPDRLIVRGAEQRVLVLCVEILGIRALARQARATGLHARWVGLALVDHHVVVPARLLVVDPKAPALEQEGHEREFGQLVVHLAVVETTLVLALARGPWLSGCEPCLVDLGVPRTPDGGVMLAFGCHWLGRRLLSDRDAAAAECGGQQQPDGKHGRQGDSSSCGLQQGCLPVLVRSACRRSARLTLASVYPSALTQGQYPRGIACRRGPGSCVRTRRWVLSCSTTWPGSSVGRAGD